MTKKDILNKHGTQIKDLGVNLSCVTKLELEQIVNFRCQHKHSAFTHPKCYRNSKGNFVEKIATFDIETSQLKANFGIILSWCIKELDGKLYKDIICSDDIRADIFDKRIVESCVARLRTFDRVCTQFGTYFDLPFVRTRAEHFELDFPKYGEIYHTDLWKIARRKLCLHSNRQGSIAETVLGHDIKTRIRPDIWLKIQFGSKKARESAMEYLIDHNIKDVVQLETLYKRLREYVHEGRTSI